jgi:hypothetical protein
MGAARGEHFRTNFVVSLKDVLEDFISCKKMKGLQHNNALKRLPCRIPLQGEWYP